MSLDFSGGVSDLVNHGSDSSLDNVYVGTILMWLYPHTAFVDNERYLAKGGGRKFIGTKGTAGNFEFEIGRAALSLAMYGDEVDVMSLNTWHVVAAVWDSGGSNSDQKLYLGSLTETIAELSGYSRQRVGSGAEDDNAAYDLAIGNSEAGNLNFSGRIAVAAMWNRQLSLGELRAQQFRPHVTNGCVLFVRCGWNGTGTQPDWSGKKNHGTLEGSPDVAPHVPLPKAFASPLSIPIVAAGVGVYPPGLLERGEAGLAQMGTGA